MVCIIKHIQVLVLTIDCKCILGQIVCSDAEEINELRQFIRDHDCRRSLDHDADLHIILKRNAFLF